MVAPISASDFTRDGFFGEMLVIDGTAVSAVLTPIKESVEVLASFGESYEHWEAAFDVAELQEAGLAAPLADGTKMTAADGRVYQVSPFKGQAHFHWLDPQHGMVAMRCKQVTA